MYFLNNVARSKTNSIVLLFIMNRGFNSYSLLNRSLFTVHKNGEIKKKLNSKNQILKFGQTHIQIGPFKITKIEEKKEGNLPFICLSKFLVHEFLL